MKCSQCGAKSEPNSKFCRECGTAFNSNPKSPSLSAVSELYGKEVDVLFFIEGFTGKIAGIVNPTDDQIVRYREAVRQKVSIENPSNIETDENIGALLTFIRQSKEYLGEAYNENQYRNFSTVDLKKEYLKLFEKILKDKARKADPKPMPAPDKK